ncbi:MAG: AraC family transcriptional regulator [Clostridia bacterium]|nr:AraC family transcriptional regulator [Clostridia bacterium]
MFYEAVHSLSEGYLRVFEGENLTFPSHLHQAFECIAVTDGEMKVKVGKEWYTLGKGDAVLVFPNQVHELLTERYGRFVLTIFSPHLVRAYISLCADRVPVSNLFHPTDGLLDGLKHLCDADSVMRIKSVLYALTDEFHKEACYIDGSADNELLLLRIFTYVRQNYGKECTLKSVSMELSYHYAYLSRYFSRKTGLTFSGYVNRFRVGESCYLLTNSRDSVTDVAMTCGFNSLRSFNRNFLSVMGITPRKYRSEYLKKTEQGKNEPETRQIL